MIDRHFDIVFAVKTHSQTTTGGIVKDTWTSNPTNYDGKLEPISETKTVSNGRTTITATHRMFCVKVPVKMGDKITVSSVDYAVIQVLDYGHHQEVLLNV